MQLLCVLLCSMDTISNDAPDSCREMCCHQSRDIPTPGFPKLPRDGEKHNPGVVF